MGSRKRESGKMMGSRQKKSLYLQLQLGIIR